VSSDDPGLCPLDIEGECRSAEPTDTWIDAVLTKADETDPGPLGEGSGAIQVTDAFCTNVDPVEDACSGCVRTWCCPEVLTCWDEGGGACSDLNACVADHCSPSCPEVP
jgi:hypothetical protein